MSLFWGTRRRLCLGGFNSVYVVNDDAIVICRLAGWLLCGFGLGGGVDRTEKEL